MEEELLNGSPGRLGQPIHLFLKKRGGGRLVKKNRPKKKKTKERKTQKVSRVEGDAVYLNADGEIIQGKIRTSPSGLDISDKKK